MGCWREGNDAQQIWHNCVWVEKSSDILLGCTNLGLSDHKVQSYISKLQTSQDAQKVKAIDIAR